MVSRTSTAEPEDTWPLQPGTSIHTEYETNKWQLQLWQILKKILTY